MPVAQCRHCPNRRSTLATVPATLVLIDHSESRIFDQLVVSANLQIESQGNIGQILILASLLGKLMPNAADSVENVFDVAAGV